MATSIPSWVAPAIATGTGAVIAAVKGGTVPYVATKTELEDQAKKLGISVDTLIDTLAMQGKTLKIVDIRLQAIESGLQNGETRTQNLEARVQTLERSSSHLKVALTAQSLIGLYVLASTYYYNHYLKA